jgi:hypothetical protein
MSASDVTILDCFALGYFLASWIGFGQFSQWRARAHPSLIGALRVFRRRWMERACQRENQQSDVAVLGNLVHGARFFASTMACTGWLPLSVDCCGAGVRKWHKAAVAECLLLRRCWGLSRHQPRSLFMSTRPMLNAQLGDFAWCVVR